MKLLPSGDIKESQPVNPWEASTDIANALVQAAGIYYRQKGQIPQQYWLDAGRDLDLSEKVGPFTVRRVVQVGSNRPDEVTVIDRRGLWVTTWPGQEIGFCNDFAYDTIFDQSGSVVSRNVRRYMPLLIMSTIVNGDATHRYFVYQNDCFVEYGDDREQLVVVGENDPNFAIWKYGIEQFLNLPYVLVPDEALELYIPNTGRQF